MFFLISFIGCNPIKERPFGFKPTYIEGSDLSYFENPTTLISIFPAGIFGPQKSGYNFQSRLSANKIKTLNYEVWFSPDFDFVRGGKLPGFCGGKGATGGDPATGNNGFSTRIMWRKDGKAINYIYHVNQKSRYGDDFQWVKGKEEVSFQRGVWQKIRMNVSLNDPEKSNGIVQTYLNDELVFEKKDFVFRTNKKIQIDRLCFNTFFGGDDSTWAPKKNEKLMIQNVKITD